MADHGTMSHVDGLSVTDAGRQRRWTAAGKLRIVAQCRAAPRRVAVFGYINGFYDPRRTHSTLG
ncbi:MAG: hypothetical protein COW55_09795 [Rhodobacteraceae bacterium CG17_big_fil_post_rev_8_21_14_2_50_65_11]|nr:MAG: hypothetical protein COW55_09795 [Rhodobacteraceae bacterium CG17_big_fil_post_rev_8_21_14_2_50_65_11]